MMDIVKAKLVSSIIDILNQDNNVEVQARMIADFIDMAFISKIKHMAEIDRVQAEAQTKTKNIAEDIARKGN